MFLIENNMFISFKQTEIVNFLATFCTTVHCKARETEVPAFYENFFQQSQRWSIQKKYLIGRNIRRRFEFLLHWVSYTLFYESALVFSAQSRSSLH